MYHVLPVLLSTSLKAAAAERTVDNSSLHNYSR